MTGGLWQDHPFTLGAGIAQHGALFNELRAHGMCIQNEIERMSGGGVVSRHYLGPHPERAGEVQP